MDEALGSWPKDMKVKNGEKNSRWEQDGGVGKSQRWLLAVVVYI